jgi:uncharacterized protein
MTSSERQPSRPALALALVFAMVFPTIAASIYFVGLASGQRGNVWQQAAYVAGKIVEFGFPIVFIWLTTRPLPSLRKTTMKGIGLGLVSGLVVMGGMLAVYFGFLRHGKMLEHTPDLIKAKLSEFHVDSWPNFLALALFVSLLHSLLEEYYWRWFVFGKLRTLLPMTPALVLASLAFMAHHVVILHVYFPDRFLTAVLPFSLGVAVGGAFWAWLYQRSGSLLGPWVSHLLIDATLFVIGWDLLQRAAG